MHESIRHRWLCRMLAALALLALAGAGAAAWWVLGAYSPTAEARAALEDSATVDVQDEDDAIVFAPAHPHAGIVFYPGARVEPEAYAPLMQDLAERGFLAVTIKPPLDFALLNADAAETARAEHPELDTWILAGHSLGGVAAAQCLAEHPKAYAGLALLASYPATDISNYPGSVLSIYGTKDEVLNRTRLEEARPLLPDDAQEKRIEGGNHACFGAYGPQDGDGEAAISCEAQREAAAEAIDALVETAVH